MFALLLTLSLTVAPLQEDASSPLGFERWLVAYRAEPHLGEFLQNELLREGARDAGILPSQDEVERALTEQITLRVESAYLGDREAWLSELSRLDLTEESWRREQRSSALSALAVDRLVRARRQISEPDVIAAWEGRYGPGGREATVRWIQVSITPPTPPVGATREEERALRGAAREAALKRAEELRTTWHAGAEFLTLQRSVGSGEEPTVAFELDEFSWPGPVRQAVSSLAIGEIAAPQAARGGWSLLQLVSAKHTPLETVRRDLTVELLAKPASSAETETLLTELNAQKTATASLPPEAFIEEPRGSGFVVGRVGDRPLKMSEFTSWLVETHGRPHADTYRNKLIIESLSDELGASFTQEEVALRREQDLDARLKLFHEDDRARWLETLTASGRTLAGWRREANIKAHHDLRAEMLYFDQRAVTDTEVRAEWGARYGANGCARTVRWILLTPKPPPAKLREDEVQTWLDKELKALTVKAAELRRRVTEGGEDFATLARRHSADLETRTDGGRLPGLFELDQQHETVAQAVAPLRAGEVSRPIRLLAGCSIYQVHKIVVTPFNEVEVELREELMTRRPSAVELVGFINQLCARER